LLIPKGNFVTVMDMDEESAAKVLSELPRLARAVKLATGCDGVNILQNNNPAAGMILYVQANNNRVICNGIAGQVVMHAHFHVIPRFEEDNLFKCPKSGSSMIPKDSAIDIIARIQSHLS
jgi:diadenosine tetraphosphate (Ap4A) HIT family hydrolase